MLERYYVQPDTIDRVRSSWIGEAIERYVGWLNENDYAARTVLRRIPLLMEFGEMAKQYGATKLEELPEYIEDFSHHWLKNHGKGCKTNQARNGVLEEAKNPVKQMLALVLPSFEKRAPRPDPFRDFAPHFFDYLKNERGLKKSTLVQYNSQLYSFEKYLNRIGLNDFHSLSPVIISGFISSSELCKTSLGLRCTVLRVFLRYLYTERILAKDLSDSFDSPRVYRLSNIPRSITWEEVNQMLETVDRRTPVGKRDLAILLLLVTYGLRAREIAALTLDNIDWRKEKLRVPERKAGHSTAYPLSPIVGEAILDYLQHGRPKTSERFIFFGVKAPYIPMSYSSISGRASYYLHKAGIPVSRPGSHTLRHTCVQRLVDADFSLKSIGDYVGHRSERSTEIYSKVAVEKLREIGSGIGEDIL
jgi:integrase/recombinase XerD